MVLLLCLQPALTNSAQKQSCQGSGVILQLEGEMSASFHGILKYQYFWVQFSRINHLLTRREAQHWLCERSAITADILRWQQTCKVPLVSTQHQCQQRNAQSVTGMFVLSQAWVHLLTFHIFNLYAAFSPEHFPTSCPKPLFPHRNNICS